jgi:AAA domain
MYSGFLSYRHLKKMQDGGNVVYIDSYKRRQEAQAKPKEPELKQESPKQEAPKLDVKSVESMFQRVGLLVSKPREYLVKSFIPRNEVCNPFGRPDSFKGVSAAQLAVHIAGGVDFLGMEVKQGLSAYFAGERGDQAKRRIKGHMRRLGLPDSLPCYFGGKPINLLSKADLDFLIANIRAIESDAGAALGFLVVDTQSRSMDGDENSTKDGAAYAKAIEAIREATLWIIAHTGHSEDAQDRPRGSSALLGAYDTFYRHKKIDERSGEIKITTDRDSLGGKELPFAVELYETGAVNEDGEPVLIPYLEAAAAPAKFTFKKGDEPKRPTPGETLMLKALRAAVRKSDHQVSAEDASGDLLESTRYVTEAEWRDEFRTLYKTGSSRQAESGSFTRGRDGLIAKGFVGACGQCYWPTVTAPH